MAAEESRAEASSSGLHVVVFPWLAFGHMIPFLELSKQLARRGHAVTFVTTPRNAARLLLPAAEERSAAAGIRVVELELPEVEGLPVGAESTTDVPPEKVELLKKAFDGLAAPFADLVAGGFGFSSRKPDWMIMDFAQYWAWPIAEEHKIASAFLFILPVSFLVFVGPKHENEAHPRTRADDFMVPPPWLPPRRSSPSTAIAYRRHEAAWIAAAFLPNTSGVSDVHRVWVSAERCRLIIDRSCPEAEPRLFPVATDLFAKPVVPAGLLLPAAADDDDYSEAADHDDAEDESGLSSWLDAQPARSVLYVAFGSEAPLTPAHVRELARGLELAGVRFLWALRETTTSKDTLLPDAGFLARVSGRGLVRVGWVPQVRVLAHAATGAFLTHCGWGSTVESLFRFGLPLVMLPFIVDQGLIARAMAARGVGVEVPRNDDDGGSFTGEDVAAAVRRVMMAEEDQAFARNAADLRKVLGDRATQDGYFEDLVQNLQRYKI